VAAAVGDAAGLSPGDAWRLPYVEACVLEALRLLPPAYMVGRCATRDVAVAGWELPQGETRGAPGREVRPAWASLLSTAGCARLPPAAAETHFPSFHFRFLSCRHHRAGISLPAAP
jgi:hypothetical protein